MAPTVAIRTSLFAALALLAGFFALALPAGAAAATVPVELAKEAGVPVVTVDRNPEGAPGDTFIATDSVSSAYEVCSHLIGLAGNPVVVLYARGSGSTYQRNSRKVPVQVV